MAPDLIKISAPRKTPHICYIHSEYKEQIKEIRQLTGISTYALLCKVSKHDLSTTESIKKFKAECRNRGFKTIGIWATILIQNLYEMRDKLSEINLDSIEVHKDGTITYD